MSEYDHHDAERRKAAPPEARAHLAKWSPWIWIVPALAIFFAGWLVVRYGFFGGGDITVRFAEARGLDRYSPVRFRGAKVGTVQKITIDKDLGQVVVRISMDASMNHALNKGTRFWIEEPGLETGGVGGLLSGTFVGIAPGQGEQTSEFVGQEYAPVLAPPAAGKTIILEGQGVGSITAGTPVEYHGMRVGRVLGAQYDEKLGVTSTYVYIVERFADRVRQSSRFWRAGGLNISLAGGGVSMGGNGLAALLSAPVAFTTPEYLAGPPVPTGTRFDLYESQAAAEASSNGSQLTYVTYFPGPINGLIAGTPVQMKGVLVGRVRDVRLRYVAQTASLETPVTYEIDPRKLEFPVNDMTTIEGLRAQFNDALAQLVRKGLRAKINSSLVLPGASGISLDMLGTPGSARLAVEHDPPIIPPAPAGGGIEGALASLNEVAARIRNLPIEEIAGNLRSTTAQVDKIVHDPNLTQSLQRVNATLADVQKVAAVTRENVEPIVKSLRNAATSADEAAARATQLMGSAAKQDYDLGALVKELTRAAESVRGLATYIEQHPDSLLKGRGK